MSCFKLNNLPAELIYSKMSSPIGELTLLASNKGLHALLWNQDRKIKGLKRNDSQRIIKMVKRQLQEYFAGKRRCFAVPVVLTGTPFQMKAWQQLRKIPYGKTISYSEQAKRMGDIKKARAVGMANSRNPIAIIIPCHRVIGKNGKLTGFAGGLDKKGYLLSLES